MNAVTKSALILLSLMVVGCAHYRDADYESFLELYHELEDDVTGDKNIPQLGFMFLYKGPTGWSNAEYRFTVNIEKNYSVELIELSKQSGHQAMDMWQSGVRTRDEMRARLDMTRIRTNATNCTIVPELLKDLWQSVTTYASGFKADEIKRIILDGGYSFNFYLTDGDYNTLKFSVVDKDHPLTKKALEFIEQIKSCNQAAIRN
ncbi:MAG: hypothetical protein HWE27_14040 [Gammaproteobacteria bacterium]|nr:hypothetical protein [Gammaproteobacteria bacterium]